MCDLYSMARSVGGHAAPSAKLLRVCTELTAARLQLLVEHLREGIPMDHACYLADLKPARVREWVRLGGDGVSPYEELHALVMKSRAAVVANQVRRINDAGGDPRRWRAAQYLLEKLDPDNFGPTPEDDDNTFDVEIVIGGNNQTQAEDDS